MPAHTTAAPDMTPPAISGRQLWKFEKWPKIPHSTALGKHFRRNLLDMAFLAAFGRLQNAIKYCTKVSKTGAAGKESNKSVTL